MKIVYAITALNKGGAERVIANLANYSVKKGDSVYILLLNNYVEYNLLDNVNVISYYKNSNLSGEKKYLKKITKFINWINFTRKKINEINPDVIVSFLPKMNFVSLIANNRKYPIIISTRNDYKIEFPNAVYRFLMKKLYPKANGFIFQTEEQKKYFDSLNIYKPYKIIPNPINDSFLVEPYDGKREKNIVSVGRLVEQKNQKLLIEAFNEIKNQIPDYTLTIFGEGKLRQDLEKLIKDLKLNDRVFLPGNVDDIKENIYKSSLFILSSDFEGMPNALLEAMSLGLPVISTDCPCGGPRTLIQNDENGILVPIKDKQQLSNAILKVLKNKEFSEKIQKNALSIQKELNPKTIYESYYNFIKNIRR